MAHPDAWHRTTTSEPHTHRHDHTSVREAGYTGDYVVHRHHYHDAKNKPEARRYSTGILKEHP